MRKLKRVSFPFIAALILCLTAAPINAGIFTDFEGYSSFTAGGNPVFDIGASVADYWVGEWDSANLTDASGIAIEEGKGWESSKALALWENDFANQGMYLFITPTNGIAKDQSGMTYLRVWMDLSGVGFRKANFGVTDGNYNLYTTDEENANATEWPFYYMADGTSEWITMYHGGDGCFGDVQDSDVTNFKGFFAFPVADFVIRKNAANHDALDDNTPAPMNNVTGVYLFWDYSENLGLAGGEKFYLDNLEFVADYTVFDSTLYVKPEPETSAPEAETAAADVTGAEAAQTADIFGITVIAAVLGFALAAIIKINGYKKRLDI